MRRIQKFIKSKERSIFTYTFLPEKYDKVYIIVHPFAEEKKSSHRALYEMADSLSKNSCSVLLFDFYGCGDSMGKLSETNLNLWNEDLFSIIEYLKGLTGFREVNLIGARFGALFSMVALCEIECISKFILIEPIFSFVDHMRFSLRKKIIKQFITKDSTIKSRGDLINELREKNNIDLDGHEISYSFYDSIEFWDEKIKNMEIKKELFQKTEIICPSYKGSLSKNVRNFIKIFKHKQGKDVHIIKMTGFWNKTNDVDYTLLIDKLLELAI